MYISINVTETLVLHWYGGLVSQYETLSALDLRECDVRE